MRADMRQRLAAIPPSARAVGEELVNAAVISDPAFASARTLLAYMAKTPELSVVSVVLSAWRAGKRVLLPRVVDDHLELHAVAAWNELAPGAFGIQEPAASATTVRPAEVDLAIVPGVAFDRKGGRLGQGGGFYDRLIPQLGGEVIGVAFDEQVVDAVPRDAHDVPVERVIHPETAME